MRSYKLYLCALFFLALTALRLRWPEEAAQVQALLAQAVDPRGDARELILTLGCALDGAGLHEGLLAVFRFAEEAFV